jgi:hypothetical protein
MRPVGDSPTRGRTRTPVAGWQPGGKPNELKPIDKATFGVVSKSPGRNGSERRGSLEIASSGGRAGH